MKITVSDLFIIICLSKQKHLLIIYVKSMVKLTMMQAKYLMIMTLVKQIVNIVFFNIIHNFSLIFE